MRTQDNAAQRDPLLEARDVSMRYGDFVALRNVSLTVGKGEIVSIVGPNGAGKTTLVNTLTGLFPPTTGEVFFLGSKLADADIVKLSTQGLARAFQLVNIFPDLTVRETLAVAASSYGGMRWRMLQNFRSNGAIGQIVEDTARAFGLHTSLDVLSSALPHGKRKLLDVASALALHPKVLLLDEPTAGVSTADKYGIMETLLAATDKMNVGAIMLVEHDMDLVSRYSTRIIAMQDGAKIADSPAKEFFQNEEVLSIVVGKGSH
ncbi:ABC transporter ATP-binding protein [Pusillimonas sp.]|uniref:ABC transporter ATP-binding protein n=1 Tax=Pusillimonas sp. TaxID=3040095 RepID=UPI0029BF5FB4|nr:ATP-binding cassette domain-containing protein [Pusillimonas sp.]MDX3895257.1 ATP-binding cassette domain-containing protein [Pusillimonas sp.]